MSSSDAFTLLGRFSVIIYGFFDYSCPLLDVDYAFATIEIDDLVAVLVWDFVDQLGFPGCFSFVPCF